MNFEAVEEVEGKDVEEGEVVVNLGQPLGFGTPLRRGAWGEGGCGGHVVVGGR